MNWRAKEVFPLGPIDHHEIQYSNSHKNSSFVHACPQAIRDAPNIPEISVNPKMLKAHFLYNMLYQTATCNSSIHLRRVFKQVLCFMEKR